MQETQVQSLDQEDPLEEEMATHSSLLAWKTSWTEESGGLQFIQKQRIGHDWATEHKMCITDSLCRTAESNNIVNQLYCNRN